MPDVFRLVKSFRYALRGLSLAWRSEQNFRVQVTAAVAVLILALVLQLSALRVVALVLMSVLVLVLELLNTFFEQLIDLLSPRLHHAVAALKNLLAAAVLVASIGSVLIGVIVFLPYLKVLVR